MIIYDLQNVGSSQELFAEGANNVLGSLGGGSGTIRFSPDSQRVVYQHSGSLASPAFINIDGTGQTTLTNVSLAGGQALWWQSGPAIPTPDHLQLSPDPVTVRTGGPDVQMTPTLFDAQGNVIFKVATNWSLTGLCQNGGDSWPRVSNTGVITPGTSTNSSTEQVCADNGGQTDCATRLVTPPTSLRRR